MKIKTGKFSDSYRGDGYMVSFLFATGWLLFGLRPLNWHFYACKVEARPALRLYVGPFEIEFFRLKP
ncbi:hypothetical protein BVY10_04705 [Pseudomonas amygdali pv. morsprunorum]|nr:hypothetical protein BVY10_04705 [Pseudomonas amygdali pv. morsprunorum]